MTRVCYCQSGNLQINKGRSQKNPCGNIINQGWSQSINSYLALYICNNYIQKYLQIGVYINIGESNGTPLQYSCLENPMDGAAQQATVHGVAGSRTRLSDFTLTFHFHALEKEKATHSSVLAWRIPGTGKPDGLPSMGVAQSQTRLKRLSSSSSNIYIYVYTHTHRQIDYRIHMYFPALPAETDK